MVYTKIIVLFIPFYNHFSQLCLNKHFIYLNTSQKWLFYYILLISILNNILQRFKTKVLEQTAYETTHKPDMV